MPPRSTTSGGGPDAASAELLRAAYRYALSLCAQPSDAEDLVQEGWLRTRERYGIDVDRRLLFRAVRNLYIDGWRRADRFRPEPLDESAHAGRAGEGGESDPARHCGHGPLGAHLAALRDAEREALLLSVIEGYSASEIGTLTARPRGTVLSLLHRARAKLQRALEDDEHAARGRRERALRLVEPKRTGTPER